MFTTTISSLGPHSPPKFARFSLMQLIGVILFNQTKRKKKDFTRLFGGDGSIIVGTVK